MAQPDALERRLRRLEGIATAGEFQRQRHVLQRRHGGNEMKALEDDADIVAAQPRPGVVIEGPEVAAGHLDAAEVARSSPPATIIRLDLPAPDGPTTAAISPAAMSREMPRRILTVPASLAMSRWTLAKRTIKGGAVTAMSLGIGYGRFARQSIRC